MEITKELKAVTPWASQDEKRPAMKHVRLAEKDGEAEAVATDGRGLAVYQWRTMPLEEQPTTPGWTPEPLETPVLLPPEAIDAVIKTLPKRSRSPVLRTAPLGRNGSPNTIAIAHGAGAAGRSVTSVQPASEEYPDHRELINHYGFSDKLRITFNADYLARIAQSVKTIMPGNQEPPVTITFQLDPSTGGIDYTAAAKFEARNPDTGKLLVVLMPIRA